MFLNPAAKQDTKKTSHTTVLVAIVTADEIRNNHMGVRVLARAKLKGGGGDKRKSSIYNSLVDLNV